MFQISSDGSTLYCSNSHELNFRALLFKQYNKLSTGLWQQKCKFFNSKLDLGIAYLTLITLV
jgi:hypothetical protein